MGFKSQWTPSDEPWFIAGHDKHACASVEHCGVPVAVTWTLRGHSESLYVNQ